MTYNNYRIFETMRKYVFIIGILLLFQHWISYSQTLQVTLSPDKSKVDRSTNNGTATIFFDSPIEDLSIICTDDNPNEPIVKVTDNLWFMHVDVKKDIEIDGVCYRNFLLKCASSAEYYLTTDPISPNQKNSASASPAAASPPAPKRSAKRCCAAPGRSR